MNIFPYQLCASLFPSVRRNKKATLNICNHPLSAPTVVETSRLITHSKSLIQLLQLHFSSINRGKVATSNSCGHPFSAPTVVNSSRLKNYSKYLIQYNIPDGRSATREKYLLCFARNCCYVYRNGEVEK